MKGKLEDFVAHHRDGFDSEIPTARPWELIERNRKQLSGKSLIISLLRQWVAAAADRIRLRGTS